MLGTLRLERLPQPRALRRAQARHQRDEVLLVAGRMSPTALTNSTTSGGAVGSPHGEVRTPRPRRSVRSTNRNSNSNWAISAQPLSCSRIAAWSSWKTAMSTSRCSRVCRPSHESAAQPTYPPLQSPPAYSRGPGGKPFRTSVFIRIFMADEYYGPQDLGRTAGEIMPQRYGTDGPAHLPARGSIGPTRAMCRRNRSGPRCCSPVDSPGSRTTSTARRRDSRCKTWASRSPSTR